MADWGQALSAGFGALADVGKAGLLSTIQSRHDQAMERVRHQYRMAEAKEKGIIAGQTAAAKSKADIEAATLAHERELEMQGLKGDQAMEREQYRGGIDLQKAEMTRAEKAPKQIFTKADGSKIAMADIIKLYQVKYKHSEFGGYPDENMESLSDFAKSIGVIDFIDIGEVADPFGEGKEDKSTGIIKKEMTPERYESLKKYFMQ